MNCEFLKIILIYENQEYQLCVNKKNIRENNGVYEIGDIIQDEYKDKAYVAICFKQECDWFEQLPCLNKVIAQKILINTDIVKFCY